MAHTFGNDDIYCTISGSAKLGGWLKAVPCRDATTGMPSRRRLKPLEAYLAMIGLVVIATMVRVVLDPVIRDALFVTYYLAAIGAAFLGGVCVGLLSVILGGLAGWYFVLGPHQSFIFGADSVFAIGSYTLAAGLMVFVIGSLQVANASIEESLSREATLTARARVADELRQWGDVFRNTTVGIIVVDPSRNLITRFANEAYAALHGTSGQDLIGKSALDTLHPTERERVKNLLAVADEEGQVSFEVNRLRKDGTIFPASVHVSSVRGRDGELNYRIGTVLDITRQREIETRSAQGQRLEAMGQLTAGVAHDFNNLLQAVISTLEVAEEETGIPQEARRSMARVVEIAEQGGKLVSQLLSFSRQQLLLPRRVNLDDFLTEFRVLASHALDPRIRISISAEEGVTPVWADPVHLKNALLNVALNSRDAMPAGGELRIEACKNSTLADQSLRHRGFVVIRITDTGSGIAPDDLNRVCEPFFSTKGLNGTGLGLSMVHGFITQSGGEFHIASELGEGTCVELLLPPWSDQVAAEFGLDRQPQKLN